MDGRGLNFVVLDNDSKCVIDCVTFDTWQISKNVTRNGSKTLSYLRDYEAAICFGE